MDEIHGYKAFNKDKTNRYGAEFEEGKTYQKDVTPKFGNEGNGFHFCKRLEDTLRYFDAMNDEIAIARVTAQGECVEYSDEYYGYYEMYSTNKIRIDQFLTRDEIIKMYLDDSTYQPEDRIIRFLQGFRLTPEEISLFKLVYKNHSRIQSCIEYYQEGKKDAYEKGYQKHRLKG